MSCYFRSPKHRTRQLFVLTMRKLATRCQSWMYCSESKVQFLQKIWPLCAALSKSGGRCQTSRRGGTHRKGNRKQGRRCPIFMYLCPIYIYVCAFYGCTCLSQLRVFLNLLSLFCCSISSTWSKSHPFVAEMSWRRKFGPVTEESVQASKLKNEQFTSAIS